MNKFTSSAEAELYSFMKYQRNKIDTVDDNLNAQLEAVQIKGVQGLAEINLRFSKEMGIEVDSQRSIDISKMSKILKKKHTIKLF